MMMEGLTGRICEPVEEGVLQPTQEKVEQVMELFRSEWERQDRRFHLDG